jgi:hypothetical protein
VGGLAAALAWWGFAAQQTLLDPSATREAAVGLLAAQPVQSAAVDSLTNQLIAMVPRNIDRHGVTDAQARSLAHNAAAAALRDPQLRRAFADAIASLQQQVIDGDASRKGLTVNAAAVTAAVRHAVARVDPQTAARMPDKPVKLHFDTSGLPSLRAVDQRAGSVTLIAALLAIAAWFGAVVVHPEPFTAMRTIGRRVVVIGALPLIFWVLVPAGLRALHFGAADVTSPLASAYGHRLAPAAFAVLAIGIGLWVAGRMGALEFGGGGDTSPRRGRRRASQFPRLDRGRSRGPVDATERLDRVDVRV